jgi:VWFA-related protein
MQRRLPPNAASGTPIRRAESRLVVVDAVVTDKKGNDLRDLAPGEFHVLEDNQEQSIKSVSRESVAGAQSGPPAHIVLLFGKMNSSELIYARERATQFIDSSVSPKRLMAILNYLDAGNVKVTQGFTADALRLKRSLVAAKLAISPARGSRNTPPLDRHHGHIFCGAGVSRPRNAFGIFFEAPPREEVLHHGILFVAALVALRSSVGNERGAGRPRGD